MFMPGFDFYEVKIYVIIFKKEKGNTFTLLIIFIVKSSKRAKYIAQIYYYESQSARINVQSPQSESTPRSLTLILTITLCHYLQYR